MELYDRALHQKTVPAIDRDFRQALQATGPDDPWSRTCEVGGLADRAQAAAGGGRAGHAGRRLDDQPLADNLLTLALSGIKDDAERVRTYSAAIGFLTEAKQAREPTSSWPNCSGRKCSPAVRCCGGWPRSWPTRTAKPAKLSRRWNAPSIWNTRICPR